MAAPLPRGAPCTANLGGDPEEKINMKRHYFLEGCVWGASRLRPGVPTFHNDVGVVLRQSLVWDETPGLFPALQPGPEMESWARLRASTQPPGVSLLGAPQAARGTCSQTGHPSSRLWEPRGWSDLAPEITRTPPSSRAPGRTAPRDPSQTAASGGTGPLPYCTTRRGKMARKGVLRTS